MCLTPWEKISYLKNISLRQLTEMVYALCGQDKALAARNIRLTVPTAEDGSEQWNAEVVVSYLIYDPPYAGK